ncbi:MAG TPA: tyrosine-type recombinase/integrase [Armatimonadota bacterium]
MKKNESSDCTTLECAVVDFLLSRQLANLSPRTIEWYEEKLGTLLDGLGKIPLSQLTIQVYRERVAARAKQVKPTTVNHHIRAFKAFVNWLIEEGDYSVNIDPRKIKQMAIEKRNPPALTDAQIVALLKQPNRETWIGLRDHCLLSLLLDTGIRIGEALTAEMDGLDECQGTLRVIGKGNKQRVVALSLPMRKIMRKWCRVRAQLCGRLKWHTPVLFVSRMGEAMKYRIVSRNIKRYGQMAGIHGVRVSAHTFRSTFATRFCQDGGSIVHLQIILGHTTLEMSRRYAAVTDEDAFEASRCHSPLVATRTR